MSDHTYLRPRPSRSFDPFPLRTPVSSVCRGDSSTRDSVSGARLEPICLFSYPLSVWGASSSPTKCLSGGHEEYPGPDGGDLTDLRKEESVSFGREEIGSLEGVGEIPTFS